MRITTEWMERNYDKYNSMIWGGQLPPVEFAVNSGRSTRGRAHCRFELNKNPWTGEMNPRAVDLTIFMSGTYESDEDVFISILIHEMIHIADYAFHIEHFISNVTGRKLIRYDGHGEVFFLPECRRIKRDFGITISPHVTEEEDERSELTDDVKNRYRKNNPNGTSIIIMKNSNPNKNFEYSYLRPAKASMDLAIMIMENQIAMNNISAYDVFVSTDPNIGRLPPCSMRGRTFRSHILDTKRDLIGFIERFSLKATGKGEGDMGIGTIGSIQPEPEPEPVKPAISPFAPALKGKLPQVAKTIYDLINIKLMRGDTAGAMKPISFGVKTDMGRLEVHINDSSRPEGLVGDVLNIYVDVQSFSSCSPDTIGRRIVEKVPEMFSEGIRRRRPMNEVKYVDSRANRSPIADGERIRVYHGTTLESAANMVANGIDGSERRRRLTPWEEGLNPSGLFVTTSFDVAKMFSRRGRKQGVVLEFTASTSDLDTPVWRDSKGPNPYMDMAPFERGERDGILSGRRKAAASSDDPSIAGSWDPSTADTLYNTRECQALFTGHISRNQIKRVWVYDGNRMVPMRPEMFVRILNRR